MRTVLACLCTTAAVVGVGAGIMSATAAETLKLGPGQQLTVTGYGYSCQSTSKTPNWGCWYGKPAGPEGTPLITVNKGSRTMLVQSRQKPKVTYNASTKTYTTTVSR
jgi:hypothetical protein